MAGTRIDNVFTALLYPREDEGHKEAITKLQSGILGKWEYYMIEHDKDVWTKEDEEKNPEHKAGELKKPHTHLVVFTKRKQAITTFANALGVTVNYTSYTNDVESDLDYLTHDGPRGEGKYKYKAGEVETNSSVDYTSRARKEASRDMTDDEKIESIMDAIDEMAAERIKYVVLNPITIGEVSRAVRNRGLTLFVARMHQYVDKLIEEANERVKAEIRIIQSFEPIGDTEAPFK